MPKNTWKQQQCNSFSSNILYAAKHCKGNTDESLSKYEQERIRRGDDFRLVFISEESVLMGKHVWYLIIHMNLACRVCNLNRLLQDRPKHKTMDFCEECQKTRHASATRPVTAEVTTESSVAYSNPKEFGFCQSARSTLTHSIASQRG
jgi:superfamily II DNA helicase RecQ